MLELTFVLEQTLGHAAHSRNIRRMLEQHADTVRSTVIPIAPAPVHSLVGRVPGLRTWSFQASHRARSAIRAQMASGRVDAVFIHTQVAALLAGSCMARVPTVVSLDATPLNFDSQGESYGHTRNNGPIEAAKLRWNRSIFHRAAALVTWCVWAAESLERDYGVAPEKVTVIHPGVDVARFRPADSPRRSGPVRILFVGGDFDRKGGPDLLEAMRRLGPRAELHAVTGSAVEVPSGINVHVHRGLAPQSPEIVSLYRDADLFVLPSRGDCFPQAVAEALAAGLPVVATTVGAIPEMVREGENGLLVPPRDPRRLGEAIEGLVASGHTRRRMGLQSRLLAEREHDADANNNVILALLTRLARKRDPELAEPQEMERAARAAL